MDNFSFQVIYIQLEFEIKEIRTVLSFLFFLRGGEEDRVVLQDIIKRTDTDIILQLGVSFLFT